MDEHLKLMDAVRECLDFEIDWQIDAPSDILDSLKRCRHFLDRLLVNQIGWEEYLFELSKEGVDIDSYLGIVESNLFLAGFG